MTAKYFSPAYALAEVVKRVHDHSDWGVPKGKKARVRYLALGACGEAGELANYVKKEWRGDKAARGGALHAKMRGEVCDIAAYAFLLAEAMDFNLILELLTKLLEVEKRPDYQRYLKHKAREKTKRAMTHVAESRARVKKMRSRKAVRAAVAKFDWEAAYPGKPTNRTLASQLAGIDAELAGRKRRRKRDTGFLPGLVR